MFQPSKVDELSFSKGKKYPLTTSLTIDSTSKPKLAKPLIDKKLRALSSKTNTLIVKRNKLDKIIRETEKSRPGLRQHWLPREKLLRKQKQLQGRERRHTKRLSQLESLYTQEPSSEQPQHGDVIQKLRSKFKTHLGQLSKYPQGLVDNTSASWPDEEETGKMTAHKTPLTQQPSIDGADPTKDAPQFFMTSALPASHASADGLAHGEKRKRQGKDRLCKKRHKQDGSDEDESSVKSAREKIQADSKQSNQAAQSNDS
ncbi:hypothetical protein F4677DRAFT_89205 [Hypoxylon crocopeplum]|nr:hypothetical protein F4677DRAFT_89205 [Hypoxylon crocopeplum]